jgi:hypothetical protein
LAHISGSFLRETVCKCPWLPIIAITSEKWVFCDGLSGFFSGWEKFRFAGECVYRSCRKNFSDFSRTHEIFFPEFLQAAKKFLELF